MTFLAKTEDQAANPVPETQQEGGVATERTTASAVTEEKLSTPQMIPGATRTQRLFALQEPATQAPFSLADWNYNVDMDKHTVTLTGYYGSDNKIKIAGRVEAGLYQDFAVAVNNLNWGINSNWITDIAFVKATDGTKVKQLEKHLQIPVLNNLTSLDLSGLDTSDVTDMSSMVRGEHTLRTINLNGLDTSKVTNMSYMFAYCENLQALDLNQFDTSNVTDMNNMFIKSNLPKLDVSSFDTSKVTNMSHMFAFCNNLQALDLGHFDTSNVTNVFSMFMNSSNLQALDISDFDLSKVDNAVFMMLNTHTLRLVNMANVTLDKLSASTKQWLTNALNNRTGEVAIVAQPDVFTLVKSDNSGTVIGPRFHAGAGHFADGTTDQALVKSQGINPEDVYASLPNNDQLNITNVPQPNQSGYNFKGWKLVTTDNKEVAGTTSQESDIHALHLDRAGLYPLDFATVDYMADYVEQRDNEKYGAKLTAKEVQTKLNVIPDVNSAFSDEVKNDNHIKEIKWKDPSKIDTGMDAVGKVVAYQATVTFVDGSTTEITVPVFVTPEDKDQYTPTIMPDVTVKKGDLIVPESVVTNQDDLPQETTIAWQTAPDTSKPGQTTGVVAITYPDKSYVEFTVMVQVKDSIPWMLIVPGQKDSVKDIAIANGHVKLVTPDDSKNNAQIQLQFSYPIQSTDDTKKKNQCST